MEPDIKNESTYEGKEISVNDLLVKLISSVIQPYPTNDIIVRCILIDFQKMKKCIVQVWLAKRLESASV